MKTVVKKRLLEALAVKQALSQDQEIIEQAVKAAQVCIKSLQEGGKVLFCGNGGSAADAQHLSAELSGRYLVDRKPLFAEALHVNTSYLTAVANDYSYADIYARLVEAMGRPGDVLVALSTSGNSSNILKAIEKAKEIGMHVIGMTGAKGGKMKGVVDVCLQMPTDDTPRIQEGHILVGHIICELIENAFVS